jgi:hypothetical protein
VNSYSMENAGACQYIGIPDYPEEQQNDPKNRIYLNPGDKP